NISDDLWCIKENGFDRTKQNFYETIFTLGNGKIGSRGVLEETPSGCSTGTFFPGVFDSVGAQVTEIVNAPNPINFTIITDGERIGVDTMDVLHYKRILDTRQGILFRRTLYKSTYLGKIDYQSYRFFSMEDTSIGMMEVFLKPIDKDIIISVESSVDISTMNKGLLTEGPKKHYHVTDFKKKGSINYIETKTFENETSMAYASRLKYSVAGKDKRSPRRVFKVKIKKGQTIRLTQYFSIATTIEVKYKRLKSYVINKLIVTSKKSPEQLLEQNRKAWDSRWAISDIRIEGDNSVQRALRFNVFHMIIAGTDDKGKSSVGARTLSGEGYRGHAFWDTEIFLLPFYIYNYPEIAKSLLLYRYNRMGEARKIAKEKGYQGVLYPWESADKGDEVTPKWVKDKDGQIVEIATSLREHHLVADVAYGVHQYIRVTGDMKFALKYGLEMILASAKFWISRMDFNKQTKKYEINHVIGPDEFHENVNNNRFTNCIAKWNIESANKYVDVLMKKHPAKIKNILNKISLTIKDLEKWKRISAKIAHTYPNLKGVIEAFDGYFKKRKIPIKFTQRQMLTPDPKYKPKDYNETQLVKQADVLMMLYLLSDKFSYETKKKNYNYYMERTLHKSSLSPSIHSILGREVDDHVRSYHYFFLSLYTDLKDVYQNTHEGMHAACLGGIWQTIINGFAGLRFVSNVLFLSPDMPAHWKSLQFCVKWKDKRLRVNINKTDVDLYLISKGKRDKAVISILGDLKVIESHKIYTLKRKGTVMQAKNIMDKKVVVLKDNFTIDKIADLLVKKKVTGAPVVNANGKFIGFISEHDVMKAARNTKTIHKKRAKDIMVHNVLVVSPDTPVEKLIEVFNEKEYRIIPVVSNKKVIGIVSKNAVVDRVIGEYY
ncbi:MAG: CBS domain-containing protein, partial [Candidatus Omnitrophica bacterium]|nr:CBS domain-containing protein [Candidatus Omnitrophota bacterium]